MGGNSGWLRGLRWAIVTIGLLVATVLLLRGNVILGGLIGAAALLRVVFLIGTSRRRSGARGRGREGGAGMPGVPVRQLLRSLAPLAFEAAAPVLGVTANELRQGFRRNHSLAEVANSKGVAVDTVVQAVARDASAAIDRQVLAGTLSTDVAERARARLPMWSSRLVYGTRADLQRAGRS